jgi:maltooligosyltrehalose trehalohydrolase
VKLSLWASGARRVDVTGAHKRAMTAGSDGWFCADVPLAPGDDYGFRVDGGPVRPDPRSPFQPHGVHGLSRVVDHSAFSWTDGRFNAPPLSSLVAYELHVGTFTTEGTFDAVASKLPHLEALGVGAIELLPVAEFPGERG